MTPMQPGIPQPDPMPLPAPFWLLWLLLQVTFLAHVLLMNLVVGGAVIGAVSRHRARGGVHHHDAALAAWLGTALPTVVAAAVTFGVAALLFLQVLYGRLFFTSSVLMAWWWLLIVPLLILAYYGRYALAAHGRTAELLAAPLAWGTAALFLVIAFLQTTNMSLMLRPDVFVARYAASASGWHLNVDDPTFAPRFLHMAFGAVAVAGAVVAGLGLSRRGSDPQFGAWAIRTGTIWFAIPTLLNTASGVWWLAVLPRDVLLRFMGQEIVASVALFAGAALGLAAFVMLALAVLTPDPSRLVRASLGAIALTILLMLLARDAVRRATVELQGFRPMGWTDPQWGAIIVFVVLLAGAAAAVVWMVRELVRSGRHEPRDHHVGTA